MEKDNPESPWAYFAVENGFMRGVASPELKKTFYRKHAGCLIIPVRDREHYVELCDKYPFE